MKPALDDNLIYEMLSIVGEIPEGCAAIRSHIF